MGFLKKDKKFVLKVKGMTCGHCKMRVETIAKGHKGVSHATVDLGEGRLTLKAKENVDLNSLKAKIKQAGYEAK
jgi:copper chaperone CopZ